MYPLHLNYATTSDHWLRRYCILSDGVLYFEPSCINDLLICDYSYVVCAVQVVLLCTGRLPSTTWRHYRPWSNETPTRTSRTHTTRRRCSWRPVKAAGRQYAPSSTPGRTATSRTTWTGCHGTWPPNDCTTILHRCSTTWLHIDDIRHPPTAHWARANRRKVLRAFFVQRS